MPKKKTENSYFEGIGRRKSAIARVRLYLIDAKVEKTVDKVKVKKGDFIINQKEVSDYFPADYQKVFYEKSLSLTNSLDRFAIVVKVNGGKKEGLLTRDARVRERRKVGTGGRARRKKQSPKR